MASIARLALENPAAGPFDWAAWVGLVRAWGQERGVRMRDAVMLVPFGQHLPLARLAWAQGGGWMPRIETTQTLAYALRPPPVASARCISFDTANDRLTAAQLLSAHAWAKRWSRRDMHAFAQAVAQLVETGQALLRSAANLHPDDRAVYWQRCRQVLNCGSGPGSLERSLALVALEWAVATGAPASDALFELRPSAWVAVQTGGAEALTLNLLKAARPDTPCALLDTDASLAAPFAALVSADYTSKQVAVCTGFEDEAQCAAAQVLAHLSQGQHPVALIAQDRLLVRRVRALLERQRVVLQDETGWKLSTTRAATQVMCLLRAAEARVTTDTMIDWLKSVPEGTGEALVGLESQLRLKGLTRAASVDMAALDGSALGLWQSARNILRTFTSPPHKSLADWLVALGAALRSSGDWERLQIDDAGQQVLEALGLTQSPVTGSAWDANRRSAMMTLEEFSAWVDTALEQASYLPTLAADHVGGAQVVITPLARAVLRPFAAVVFPGADEKRLGPPANPPVLLGETLAAALGLPPSQALRDEQTLAFAQMLRVPHVSLLRRSIDGADSLAASPLLERLALAAQRADAPLGDWVDPRIPTSVVPRPVKRPAPQALPLLPQRMSASACESLRACPYRFFALHVLRLSEAEELEDQVDKRDYGSWLHRVLYEFHHARVTPEPAAQELATLRACGATQQLAMGLAEAEFLPFGASFSSFAPRYIEWLHRRDAGGAQWLCGEYQVSTQPVEIEGLELYGRIDRVDRTPPNVTQLIDYKTGSAQSLKDKLKQPLEDTQLAFYAALMAARTAVELQASYLALDDAKGIQEIAHPHVGDSARQLVAGLANEYARLRQGAGLPALGERKVCDYCEARGLCRRDQWATM